MQTAVNYILSPAPAVIFWHIQIVKEGLIVWFTGLPSAGKTTISREVAKWLLESSHDVEVLDGDAIRADLCRDLGFSRPDREENIRRLGFVAAMLARHGVIVLVAAISPYRASREAVRRQSSRFVEVYVNSPLSVCEARDVKGLYKKARGGGLKGFTGVDDLYEPPLHPELECRTDRENLAQSVLKVSTYLVEQFGILGNAKP